MATNTSRAEARNVSRDYWLMQQGRNFWIERGTQRPSLEPQPGEKRKLTLGSYHTEDEAKRRFAVIQKLYVYDDIELGGAR